MIGIEVGWRVEEIVLNPFGDGGLLFRRRGPGMPGIVVTAGAIEFLFFEFETAFLDGGEALLDNDAALGEGGHEVAMGFSVGFDLAAFFPGKDAHELEEDGGFGFGIGGEGEGALFNNAKTGGVELGGLAIEEVKKVLDAVVGFAVGSGLENAGEIELFFVAEEFVDAEL